MRGRCDWGAECRMFLGYRQRVLARRLHGRASIFLRNTILIISARVVVVATLSSARLSRVPGGAALGPIVPKVCWLLSSLIAT